MSSKVRRARRLGDRVSTRAAASPVFLTSPGRCAACPSVLPRAGRCGARGGCRSADPAATTVADAVRYRQCATFRPSRLMPSRRATPRARARRRRHRDSLPRSLPTARRFITRRTTVIAIRPSGRCRLPAERPGRSSASTIPRVVAHFHDASRQWGTTGMASAVARACSWPSWLRQRATSGWQR